MSNTEWLQSLKVGDEVAIRLGGWGPSRWEIRKVTHATKTQITVGDAAFRKYRRKNGRACGNPYSSRIDEPTPELREEMTAENRRDKAMAVVSKLTERSNWRDWETPKIEQLARLLTKLSKPRKESE